LGSDNAQGKQRELALPSRHAITWRRNATPNLSDKRLITAG
jgi:hypothetical protein